MQAHALTTDPLNPIVLAAARDAPRGTIYASNGEVLADNVAGNQRQREYPVSRRGAGCWLSQLDLRHGRAREGLRLAADRPGLAQRGRRPAAQVPVAGVQPGRSAHVARYRPAAGCNATFWATSTARWSRSSPPRAASWRWSPAPRTTRTASSTRTRAASTSHRFRRAATRRCSTGPRRACTCRARSSRSSPPRPGLSSGAITPDTTYADQPGEIATGFLVDGFRVHDFPRKVQTDHPLNFYEATEVSDNIWFAHAGLDTGPTEPRRLGGALRLRPAHPVRAADVAQPGDWWRRAVRRLPRSRRAGQCRLRSGGGARHAAADGAGRGDDRQSRPRDAAQARRLPADGRRHAAPRSVRSR